MRFYQKYERWVPIAAFFAGFVFDLFMMRRIDELKVIAQQAVYLVISAALIGVELIGESRGEGHEMAPPRFVRKLWRYREAFLHFLLGTLLNSYTIFYFKSASALTSFLFIGLLIGLLILNEFVRFGKSQSKVHVAFLSLCLVSFLTALSPILLGFLGMIPFIGALAASLGVFVAYRAFLKPQMLKTPSLLKTHLSLPFLGVQAVFAFLYFFHFIPPVPLSVQYLGIYHGVQKVSGGYELASLRPSWKFWQNGDQTFLARPGDVIYCFAQIFSPSRFSEKLQVRWLYWDDKRGWVSSDAIPLPIMGGREEGYRAVTKKSNFQPGAWRVQVETLSHQEVGRIGLTVLKDDSTGDRAWNREIR